VNDCFEAKGLTAAFKDKTDKRALPDLSPGGK
jgi:hypothetical protein